MQYIVKEDRLYGEVRIWNLYLSKIYEIEINLEKIWLLDGVDNFIIVIINMVKVLQEYIEKQVNKYGNGNYKIKVIEILDSKNVK